MAGGLLLLLYVICVISVAYVTCEDRKQRIVNTTQGPVRGYSVKEDSVFIFYGIPYATAPSGRDKFKAPLPASTWLSVFDAVDKKISCPQGIVPDEIMKPKTPVEQNCLVANVYVPETEERNLPVVVYVHGGAYQFGSGTLLETKRLVRSHKIIMVSFNYRLGIHGFLCLGTNDIPGNAGMKDQVALLRWVNKNIASFGGNPEDVTIAGYSAGASAVDLLVLSPSAKGLFNKAILESGANLDAWFFQIDPFENAKLFAKSSGFENVDDIYALEEFYKSASFDLLTPTGGFSNYTDDLNYLFSPCVEGTTMEEAFLTDNPYNILKSEKYDKVPLLCGFTNMEGILRLSDFEQWKDRMNTDFSEFIPIDLKFKSEEERKDIGQEIKRFYFGDKLVSNDSLLSYIDFTTDVFFAYSALRTVRLYAESGNDKIYLYEYSFVDDTTPALPYTDNVKGATHCAQSVAVADQEEESSNDSSIITEEYKKMKTIIREMWSNFIKLGTPVPAGSSLPAWPPVVASGAPHMSLGRTLELRGALLERRARFWDDIYERYYGAPLPPQPPPARPSS